MSSPFRVLDPGLGSPYRIVALKEAAEISGYSYRGMVDLSRRGDGPPVIRFSATHYGVRLLDLDDWLASRRTVRARAAA